MLGVEKDLRDLHSNKRMQSDHPIRYANGLAADAWRYEVLENCAKFDC